MKKLRTLIALALAGVAAAGVACRTEQPAVTEAVQPKTTKPRTAYFIPFGDFPATQIQSLADYYHQKLKLECEVLPPIDIPVDAINKDRQQIVAERLIDGLRVAHPDLAAHRDAVLIGITDNDMYLESENWAFAFASRDEGARAAVVSSARMNLHYPGEPPDQAKQEIRLRKMVAKSIGILCFNLPQNDNPRSVLYNGIMGIQELDQVGEDF